MIATRTISPDYFSVVGIALVSGRVFSESDKTGSPSVAIINEYLAKELFPNGNAIGQTLFETDSKGQTTVVGVVRSFCRPLW